MASLLILYLLSAVAATVIAYVIGRCNRTTPRTVTSPTPAGVTKETASQAGQEETGFGETFSNYFFLLTLCLTLSRLCLRKLQ